MAYQCTSMSFQNICNIKDIDSNIVICSNNISPTLTSFEPKQQISQSFTNVFELETSQEAMSVDTSYEENNQNPDELSQPLFVYTDVSLISTFETTNLSSYLVIPAFIMQLNETGRHHFEQFLATRRS